METIIDLLKRVNSLDAQAEKKGLNIAFYLEEDMVRIHIFTIREGVLDYQFRTERSWGYSPQSRDPEISLADMDAVLTEGEAFVADWKGKDAEQLSKEIADLEARLTGKRKQLAKITEGAK